MCEERLAGKGVDLLIEGDAHHGWIEKADVIAGDDGWTGELEFFHANHAVIKQSMGEFAKDAMTKPVGDIHFPFVVRIVEARRSPDQRPDRG